MGITFSTNSIQALVETNKNESIEFLNDFLSIGVLLSIFCFIAILVLIYMILEKVEIFKGKRRFILVILLISSFIYTGRAYLKHGTTKIYEKMPATRLYQHYEMSMRMNEKYSKIKENFDKMNIDVMVDKENNIENIVLIIGESATKNHMELYGYNLNNNPILIEQEKAGNLYKYNDVISPHAQTTPSLEKMLTFKNYETSEPWYSTPDIINVMKKSGFKTYWFSNQGKIGVHDNIAYAFARLTDKNIFNEDSHMVEGKSRGDYDIELVDIAKENLENINGKHKNFIVFHLDGSHYTYLDRYPKDFKEFDTTYLDEKLTDGEKGYIARYDTTILFNDYVVSEIHNIFQDTNTIVIYASDHGEELYEVDGYRGHTEGRPSRYMLEIPFTIFVTDKFKAKNRELVENIEKSLNNKYMTDDLPHTILDFAGIRIKNFDETRSVINPKFDNNRKRMYHTKEYDTYWKIIN